MFIQDPNFSIPDPGSRVKKIPDPHQRITVFLTQKIVSNLSEIWSRMFISNPDLDFCYRYPSWIPDQGVKKASVPRFGSATLALRTIKPLLFKKRGKTSLPKNASWQGVMWKTCCVSLARLSRTHSSSFGHSDSEQPNRILARLEVNNWVGE